MSFTIVDRQPGGCSGEIGPGYAGKQVERWTFVADNANHTPEMLRTAGFWGQPYTAVHVLNPLLVLRPIEIEQSDENPALFFATLTWESTPLTPSEKAEQNQNQISPLDRKARIRIKSAKEQVFRHRDFYGKPKVNAAGDSFDPPPPANERYKIITIRKNVTVFPDWVFDFDDCINDTDFVLKGRTIKAGEALIDGIELGEEQNQNGIAYAEATIQILWKKFRRGLGRETPEHGVYSPWNTEALNEGLHGLRASDNKRYRIKIKDQDDNDVFPAGPVPLDFSGQPINLDSMTLSQREAALKFRIFEDHEIVNFGQIAFLWSNA